MIMLKAVNICGMPASIYTDCFVYPSVAENLYSSIV